MERIKITDISEIWDGENLLKKDFINLDLEGIDLSQIPIEEWEGCIFCNTSFKNTQIKFKPNKLSFGESRFISIHLCDFSDNDLSYLEDYDFEDVFIDSCNFKNTKLSAVISEFENLFLDETYPYKKWDLNYYVDIQTIINNPFIVHSSALLFNTLTVYLNKRFEDSSMSILELILFGEEYLKYDKLGDLRRIYEYLKPQMDINEKEMFFRHGIVSNKKFEHINLGVMPSDLISMLRFKNCTFNDVILENDINSLGRIHPYVLKKTYDNEYKDIHLPSITFSSWQDAKNIRRISDTPFTYRTNLYLELGRSCNAKCLFCRNQSYENCKYCYDNVIDTLKDVYPYVNSVVVGGGEPTTRKKDLDMLFNESMTRYHGVDWYIFTNGSDLYFDSDTYYSAKYNISRHAVKDKINAKIFGLSENDVATTKDLEHFIDDKGSSNVTLCSTCFKGGLDNEFKIINYINYCVKIGCKNILISDLQKSVSLGTKSIVNDRINIRPGIFNRVIKYLELLGFEKSIPIYATGGYTSTVLKNDEGLTIAFKHYITEEELEKEWTTAIKRTFDLSIDPSGNLYENWHQSSESVKIIRKNQ